MFMNNKSMIPIALICCFILTLSSCAVSNNDILKQRTLTSVRAIDNDTLPESAKPVVKESLQNTKTELKDQSVVSQSQQTVSGALSVTNLNEQIKNDDLRKEPVRTQETLPFMSSPFNKNSGTSVKNSIQNTLKANPKEAKVLREEETERDIMEEALVLLDESHKYWVKGEMEDALEMLDQAYALLLDANGNPDIARQKDDLRLMISKRIMTIYNSLQSVAKGKRGEIPIITNPDVEKEIRQFQTVERDFFISSYQRSMIFRPIILRELKKAGLPEELSWLPLVESGFKINALSTARALGLWQFIPSTGYKYGLNRDEWVDERMDVEKSTRAAIDYFKDLHAMFGDWLTVLAGYNCGEGRVGRTIASQHINYLDRFWDLYSRLPYETARYVPRFLATLLIVKDPQKYGIDLGSAESKIDILSYETAETDRSMRLQDVAQKLETSEEILYILNAELRHRMTPDRPYKLKVPHEKAELLLKIVAEIPRGEKPRASLQSVRGVFIKHKVKQGETLDSIAAKYKTTAGAVRSANNLSKQRLVVGQRLNVPIRVAQTSTSAEKETKINKTIRHQVQKGDSLNSICRKYDISVTEIMRINNLKNDTLKIGQTLRIEKETPEVSQVREQRKGDAQGNKANVKAGAKTAVGKTPGPQSSKKYTVKKGDSLNLIARENGMTLDQLLKMNNMVKTDIISPGQVILIQ
jgi:membrane-bound lytic murein transglycosylase D